MYRNIPTWLVTIIVIPALVLVLAALTGCGGSEEQKTYAPADVSACLSGRTVQTNFTDESYEMYEVTVASDPEALNPAPNGNLEAEANVSVFLAFWKNADQAEEDRAGLEALAEALGETGETAFSQGNVSYYSNGTAAESEELFYIVEDCLKRLSE